MTQGQKNIKFVTFCWIYFGSRLRNCERCRSEIGSITAMPKAAFGNKKNHSTSTMDLHLRRKLVMFYMWGIVLYDAETWLLWNVNQKYGGSFKTWCWRRMEKISWTNHVRNEEEVHRVKEGWYILHKIKRGKDNWIGHILPRNWL